MVLSETNTRRDQHALNLPGNVALEAADDLSLALAFCGTPCDVLLGATISSHSSQTDHVQRSVGLPVATAVETVAHYLPRGGFHRRHSAQTGEGGLTPQPLGIVRATISSVAAWSVPMPAKETSSGATCLTSRSSWASSSAISAERASYRRATERSANLVAAGTSRGSSPRRKRAATETSSFVESSRKRLRSFSGAVRRKPWSWLAACVLAFIAERRAARK